MDRKTLVALLAVAVLLLNAVVNAELDQERREEERRRTEMRSNSEGAVFVTASRDGRDRSYLRMWFQAHPPRFGVIQRSRTAGTTGAPREDTRSVLRVVFRDLVEYTENGDTDSGFDADDTEVARVDLGGRTQNWDNLVCTSTDYENGTLYDCNTGMDLPGAGRLEVRLRNAEFVREDGGAEILPDSLKFDVNIVGYGAATGNRVALDGRVFSREDARSRSDPTGEISRTHTYRRFGTNLNEFAWADAAQDAVGVDIPVVVSEWRPSEDPRDESLTEDESNGRNGDGGDTSNPSEGKEKSMRATFSFARDYPVDIYWDPIVGRTPLSGYRRLILIAGAAVGGVVVLGAAAMALTRRGRAAGK